MEKKKTQKNNSTNSCQDKCPYCGYKGKMKSGIVLDPFMGSGTTAVVAQKLGRDFVGIEISEEYIKIAKKRLAQNYFKF